MLSGQSGISLTVLTLAENNSTPVKVVRRKGDFYTITGDDSYVVFAHFS